MVGRIFKIILISIVLFTSFDTRASDGKVSISANVFPDLQNQNVDDIANSEKLDDSAYAYTANYTWHDPEALFGRREYEYVSIRFFKFIESYTEGGVDGASDIEGIAIFYGQRYMLSTKDYSGAGFGWYAGVAIGSDTYIEPGITEPETEGLFATLAAAEFFYKLHLTESLFFEPSYLIAKNKQTNAFTPVAFIIAGLEF